MTRHFFLAVLGLFLLSPNALFGSVLSGPIVNPTNGNDYYLLDTASWPDSQTEAESLGGNLVSIDDAVEDGWVFDTFATFGGTNRSLWIGLTDQNDEGNFTWISGQTVDYINWSAGEPNNADNTEDYVYMVGLEGFGLQLGNWNDIPVSGGIVAPLFGIVEVQVPEPSSLVLAALVPFLLLAKRPGTRL